MDFFQKDALFHLHFYLAFTTLSKLWNNTGYGRECKHKWTNHLFYVDELKLYARSYEELEGILRLTISVMIYSWHLGLDEWANATFKWRNLISRENIFLCGYCDEGTRPGRCMNIPGCKWSWWEAAFKNKSKTNEECLTKFQQWDLISILQLYKIRYCNS